MTGEPPRIACGPGPLAEMPGVTTQALADWRRDGIGPAFVRMGGSHAPVACRVEGVERYLADNRVETDTRGRRRR